MMFSLLGKALPCRPMSHAFRSLPTTFSNFASTSSPEVSGYLLANCRQRTSSRILCVSRVLVQCTVVRIVTSMTKPYLLLSQRTCVLQLTPAFEHSRATNSWRSAPAPRISARAIAFGYRPVHLDAGVIHCNLPYALLATDRSALVAELPAEKAGELFPYLNVLPQLARVHRLSADAIDLIRMFSHGDEHWFALFQSQNQSAVPPHPSSLHACRQRA